MNSTAQKTIRRRAAHLREQIADCAANVDSLRDTKVEIGERCGWDDPRLPLIEQDIRAIERTSALLRSELRLLRSALAA